MKLSEYAASIAIKQGAFLMAGDTQGIISAGDVIPVTARFGLRVISTEQMHLMDAPLPLVNVLCELSGEGFTPIYSDLICETPHQAALAQMLHDAGEGFDIDDLLDWQSLEAGVSVVTIEQVVNYGNQQ